MWGSSGSRMGTPTLLIGRQLIGTAFAETARGQPLHVARLQNAI